MPTIEPMKFPVLLMRCERGHEWTVIVPLDYGMWLYKECPDCHEPSIKFKWNGTT